MSETDTNAILLELLTEAGEREVIDSHVRKGLELIGLEQGARHPGRRLSVAAWMERLRVDVLPADASNEVRSRFTRAVARVARELLVEQAKLGIRPLWLGSAPALREPMSAIEPPAVDVIELDRGLEMLEEVHPELAELVTIGFFGGCSWPETARALGLDPAEVRLRWDRAQRWLDRRVGPVTSIEAAEPAI